MKSRFVIASICLFVVAFIGKPSLCDDQAAYPYQLQPLEILSSIADLDKSNDTSAYKPCAEELELAKTLNAPEVSNDQWANAFLIASGDCDATTRQRHLKQLDTITKQLRKSTAGLTGRQFGEKLLQELHTSLMTAGYDKQQTSISVLLDSSTFNCVSATALYFLQAQRFKLTIEIIEFPGSSYVDGHVMLMFVSDNEKIDVETTNPDGFDIRAKIAKDGGISFGVKDLADGRTIDAKGLLLSIYNNRATMASEADQHLASLRMRALMLAISPDSKECQESVMSAYMNWMAGLIKENKPAAAIAVGRMALGIAPKHEGVLNNLKVAHANAAESHLKEAHYDDAVKLYKDANISWPDQNFNEELVSVFSRSAFTALDEGHWPDATKPLTYAVEHTEGTLQDSFREQLMNLYLNRSSKLIESKEFESAAQVLRDGLRVPPTHSGIINNVSYLAQESFRQIDTAQGPEKVNEWKTKLTAMFPENTEIAEVCHSHVHRLLDELIDAGKYGEAIEALSSRQDLVGDSKANELKAIIYDREARSLTDKEQWEQAAKIYSDAFKACGKDDRLITNAPLVYDQWARKSMDKKDWTEAIRIYKLGLQEYSDSSLLAHNLEYCQQFVEKN